MTTIHTIGHGNRPGSEFAALLARRGIRRLVDVRALPASRRHPQFARGALEQALTAAGIEYRWEGPALGGRRRPARGSRHVALRNASFRAYADHMMAPLFQEAMARLLGMAETGPTAIMCAERLPWQCHRYLIADSLETRGIQVLHILSEATPQRHAVSRLVRLEGDLLVYDKGIQPGLQIEPAAAAGC